MFNLLLQFGDKKIEILENKVTVDKIGNHVKQLVPVATVWAYFRQLSADEIYRVTTQTEETVLFRINYRDDISTANVIKYKDTLYNITRIDVYEGYKNDLTLYCKKEK